MSYAIIRNAKMKMGSLSGVDKHNERKNENYSNKDIDQAKTKYNYHLIKPQKKGYKTEFDRIREEENLKGNLRINGGKQSNVACEFLITSDNAFFKNIGEERTKEFFTDSLEFVKNKVGEKHIISAVIHLDETTPHMHVIYIPVVEKANKKGIVNKRINCSEFWKGFNSYGILQDDFYKHCVKKGYNLERGEIGSRAEHLEIAEYKAKTSLERVEQAQDKINALESEIKPLQSKFDDYKALNTSVIQIDEQGTKSALGMTLIKTKDLKKLKEQAKCYIANRDELDNIRQLSKDIVFKETKIDERNREIAKTINKLDKQKEELYLEYKKQININQILEKTEKERDKYKKNYRSAILIKEKSETEVKNLRMDIKNVYKKLTEIIKAMNMLKHSKNNYKVINLTEKQSDLIDGISKYAIELAKNNGYKDYANSMNTRIGISDNIKDIIEPEQEFYDYLYDVEDDFELDL